MSDEMPRAVKSGAMRIGRECGGMRLVLAGDEDVEFIRFGVVTHRKGLPGLTLCGDLAATEWCGAAPSDEARYEKRGCKKCKAEEIREDGGEPASGAGR